MTTTTFLCESKDKNTPKWLLTQAASWNDSFDERRLKTCNSIKEDVEKTASDCHLTPNP